MDTMHTYPGGIGRGGDSALRQSGASSAAARPAAGGGVREACADIPRSTAIAQRQSAAAGGGYSALRPSGASSAAAENDSESGSAQEE
jgi:hypothetical protein